MNKEALASVALTWAQRAQAELGAEARFKVLTEELIDAGSHVKVIRMSQQARVDERRHAQMCVDVAKEFGHPTGYAYFEGQKFSFEKPWLQRPFAEQLLCEIVLMCCITETINASLLNSIYAQSKDSPAKKIIQQILKDEVKHSQMGWAHLSLEAKDSDCSFISDYLPYMLDISIKDELFAPAPIVDDQMSFEYGVMPLEFRLDQFKNTFNEIVMPGFKQFGIDAHKAQIWFDTKTA